MLLRYSRPSSAHVTSSSSPVYNTSTRPRHSWHSSPGFIYTVGPVATDPKTLILSAGYDDLPDLCYPVLHWLTTWSGQRRLNPSEDDTS